ncbi:Zinc-binding alcohol dehydrogenase family protein [Prunus dulcis]|uniref:Zinc-binding alcohol dehydrogenase family protein n=1 Tax=Prunus dulcis TaxID=3755 RepID=A0A4Y1QVR6_PRUDU|nr:Zinc-binding alcohol dehydrogenase family protein [Prunus dulcis]
MREYGHRVRLATDANFKDFVLTAGLEFIPSGGDQKFLLVIKEMTGGGADYCFECVGLISLVQEAYACCRKLFLGMDKPGSQVTVPSLDIICGKTLTGSLFGGLKPKSDIAVLINRYKDKELQLDEFVTHEIRFEEINKAFDLLIEGKCLRCVIYMTNE